MRKRRLTKSDLSPSTRPEVRQQRVRESRARLAAQGHKRMSLMLSGPAEGLLRGLRETHGMTFNEAIDRALMHPDAEACVIEVTRTAPDEPLF